MGWSVVEYIAAQYSEMQCGTGSWSALRASALYWEGVTACDLESWTYWMIILRSALTQLTALALPFSSLSLSPFSSLPFPRGIFHNDAQTALAWVNEEDHCRIISMELGGDIPSVFTRFCALSEVYISTYLFTHWLCFVAYSALLFLPAPLFYSIISCHIIFYNRTYPSIRHYFNCNHPYVTHLTCYILYRVTS